MRKLNTNETHPEYWKFHEKRLLAEVKELGLKADFLHTRSTRVTENKKGVSIDVPMPRPFADRPDRFYTDITGAYLWTEEELERLKEFKKEHPDDESNVYQPVAEGRAYCSHLDNFSKRIGRTIALDRALESYREKTKEQGNN